MFRAIKNDILRNVLEWVLAIAITAAVYFILRLFIYRTAEVTGSSMEPTLTHGDVVLINRTSYFFTKPKENDVVAFPYKEDPTQVFVKRIIAMPGDTVDLTDRFIINGKDLSDDFSEELISTQGNISFPFVVPEDSYFVLGDNRNGSRDSRYAEVGCIARKEIMGKIFVRLLPFDSFKIIK